MRIFSYIYHHVMSISRHRNASATLALVTFIEAILLPFPPDILLMSMTLADKSKWIRFSNIATIFSVIGGIIGYMLGAFFIDAVYGYVVQFGYQESYQLVQLWFIKWGFWVVFLAGFTPIPYKIFTIASGAFHLNFIVFVVASIISRGARFFLVSYLIYRFEDKFKKFAIKYLDIIGWGTVLIAIVAYLIWR